MAVDGPSCRTNEWVPSIFPAGKPVAVQLIPELAVMICGQILCISHVGHGRLELGPACKGHDKKSIQISFVGIHNRVGEAFTDGAGS